MLSLPKFQNGILVYQGEELEDKDPLILPISHHANSVGPNSSKIVIKRVIWT